MRVPCHSDDPLKAPVGAYTCEANTSICLEKLCLSKKKIKIVQKILSVHSEKVINHPIHKANMKYVPFYR